MNIRETLNHFWLITVLAVFTSSIAEAKVLTVNAASGACGQASDIYCSIQSAINNAKPNDIINISSTRYRENLIINKNITLQGDKNGVSIIDANRNGSAIVIKPGNRVRLKYLTIINGKSENGGGIFNEGSLMLSNSTVSHNIAQQAGGGIFNKRSATGSLLVESSRIVRNKSLGDDKYNIKYGGGGIYNDAPLVIIKSNINNNYATDNGGGIYSVYSGRKNASNSQRLAEKIGLLAAPQRRNSLYRKTDQNAVVIHQSIIKNNQAGSGGGINLQGVMNIKNSSIIFNQAINHNRSAGGGVFAHLDTTLNIYNTFIAHNQAIFRGAGLRFYSTKSGTLKNVAIINNKLINPIGQGAGIFLQNHTQNFHIQNTLIADNKDFAHHISDCAGKITSAGYNLVSNVRKCQWISQDTDIINPAKTIDAGIKWNRNLEHYRLKKNSPLLINKCESKKCIIGVISPL